MPQLSILQQLRDWLPVLTGTVTLAASLWKGRWLLRRMKTAWLYLTGVGALSEQLCELNARLSDSVANAQETLAALREIRSQLRPNGGTSLHDVVHSMAAAQRARDDRDQLPLFWTDGTGRVTHVNRAFQQLTGRTREELCGTGWVNSVAVEDRERVLDLWRDAVDEGRDLDDRFRLRTGGDQLRHYAVHACRLMDHSGRLLGYYGELRAIE